VNVEPPTRESVVAVDVGVGYPVLVTPGEFYLPAAQAGRAAQVLRELDSSTQQIESWGPEGDFVAFRVGAEAVDAPAQHGLQAARDATPEARRAVTTVAEVDALRRRGIEAAPDHVFLSHSVSGFPMSGFPMSGFPMSGFPMSGFPMSGFPMSGFPMSGFPAPGVDGFFAGGISLAQRGGRKQRVVRPGRTWPGSEQDPPTSTAEPASDPGDPQPSYDSGGVSVLVLDTGLADDGLRPAGLTALTVDQADVADQPDADGDQHLDVQAGHGTFIAGLIGRLAPSCSVTVRRVLSSDGTGRERDLADRLHEYAGKVDIVNLSLGTYTPFYPRMIERAVRAVQLGIGEPQATGVPPRPAVVVASAGNDGTWLSPYPAALADVVSVGALGPDGPAPFSNYGPWVRACAPGTDIVSTFFQRFDGPTPGEADDFHGWARWSGTSFAAPVVVAALARRMMADGITAAEAVERVIDAHGLLRLPMFGTVVNLI
jgi:hypothetical protein